MKLKVKPNMGNAAKHIKDLTNAPAALAIESLSVERFDMPEDLEDAFKTEEEAMAENGDHMSAEQLDEGTVPVPNYANDPLTQKALQHPECIETLRIRIDRKGKAIFPAEGHVILRREEIEIYSANYDPSDTETVTMIYKALAMYEIVPEEVPDPTPGLKEELTRVREQIERTTREMQKWKDQEQKLKEALKRLGAER